MLLDRNARPGTIDAVADESSDLREFMREFLLRWERSDRQRASEHDEVVARFNALTQEIVDHREETRAQTQALLRFLDRMSRFGEGNGGEAPA
jgi:hypothetical protein